MEDIQEELNESKIVLIQSTTSSIHEPSCTDSDKSIKQHSCTALCGLFSSVVRNLNCKRKKKRSVQAELSCTPQNGLMVQMIPADAEAKVEATAEDVGETSTLKVDDKIERRSSWHSDIDEAGSAIFLPRVTSFSGGLEAEERLLSRVAGRTPVASSRPRFLTLHKRKKRKPPTRGLLCNSALLDDLYNGPTQCVLSRVALWNFNAFALDSVCGGRPVTVLCVYLLHEYKLIKEFELDSVTVWKCFSLIEEGYHASNPYHNAIHAADVTQAMHCYLLENAIAEHLTPFEKLAAIIASVCHDLDHPGVNQPFLIATDNHLAALYNNASVLENHHWRCAMGCLYESGFLNNWSPENVAQLQEEISSLILATDITRQNEFLSKFKKYQESKTLDMSQRECRHFSLQIALKCADICNPCRPWEVSRQWSHKICDEFYRQGDYERQLQLPVTSLCDRYVNSVAKIQTGFIKFVVSPLFDSWNNWLRTDLSKTMHGYLRENLVRWESFLEEEKKHMADESLLHPVCSASSTASSIGSQGSVLGAMETSASLRLPLGRRYSLPLTVPSLLPRTIIRRESLCESGQPTLILETVQMGEMSVASVITSSRGEVDELGFDSTIDDILYPEPTIAAMGEVGRPRKTNICRRQSLPPLWDASFVPTRMIRPLEVLPATPLQEETPTENEEEPTTFAKPKGCEVSEGQHHTSCTDSLSISSDSSTSEVHPSVDVIIETPSLDSEVLSSINDATPSDSVACEAPKTADNVISEASPSDRVSSDVLPSDIATSVAPPSDRVTIEASPSDRVTSDVLPSDSVTSEALPNDGVTCVSSRDNITIEALPTECVIRDIPTDNATSDNIDREFPSSVSANKCVLNVHPCGAQDHAMPRRSSLDNGKRDLKNENLMCKWPRLDNDSKSLVRTVDTSLQKHSRDKENVAPPDRISERHILKTRLWRSLNHEDEFCPDNRVKAAMYKNLNQISNFARDRRGSAPILKFESVRGSLRVGADINPEYLCRRRCSAPSNQIHLHLGSEALRLHPDENLCQVPLLSKENLMPDEDRNGNFISRLAFRRGSMPCDILPGNAIPEVNSQQQFSEFLNTTRINRGGFGGGDYAGHSTCEGSTCLTEGRRGSSGFELLSGLWRYHLGGPISNSSCSDDSVGISSSGGATPGTPGTVGPLTSFQVSPSLLPTPYSRRGSLPTDVYTSVDARKWRNEAS